MSKRATPSRGACGSLRRRTNFREVRAYRVSSLQALVDLGGRSELHPVLDRVHEAMRGQLNEHDLAVLPSDGVTPRWRNTAQWARNSLREEGLIRDDTPRAIWEISAKGREWLKGQQENRRPASP